MDPSRPFNVVKNDGRGLARFRLRFSAVFTSGGGWKLIRITDRISRKALDSRAILLRLRGEHRWIILSTRCLGISTRRRFISSSYSARSKEIRASDVGFYIRKGGTIWDAVFEYPRWNFLGRYRTLQDFWANGSLTLNNFDNDNFICIVKYIL